MLKMKVGGKGMIAMRGTQSRCCRPLHVVCAVTDYIHFGTRPMYRFYHICLSYVLLLACR